MASIPQSNGAAAEASATSILGIDHATKLSPIPSLAEIHCLLETAGRNVLKVANSLGHEKTTRDAVCKALVKAFLDIIPMPKNDDHSHVSLGPLLDNFKDVKSDPRVKAHDNDSLRLSEEKLRVACTAASKDDGAVEVAAKNLRAAVEKMMPDMRLVIAEAIAKKGRTLEWVRVATTGNVQFSKVYRSVFEFIKESEKGGVKRYKEVIGRIREVLPGGKAPLQGPDNLVDLYVEAARAQNGFKTTMEELKRKFHERTQGKELKLSVCAKLKKVTRILEKMIMRGSVKGVKDIVRAMATLDDMDNVAIVAELMLELHKQGVIKLLRIKERFFDQPSGGGWRDLMINFTVGSERHIVELQIAHSKMLTARKGLPGHAVYGKTRNCMELLTMDRGSADVAGLADFFGDFVDDVETLESEALQRVPHWFHDDVPVCDWEGITADSKGRITEVDVRVADPEFIGAECQLPNLKRLPLSYMGEDEDPDSDTYGEYGVQGVKLVTTAYLRALARAHPSVDITCGGKMRLTHATCDQNGISEALKPFSSHVRVFEGNSLEEPKRVKALVPALQAMTGLKSLNLACNELEAEDAKALAPALEAMTGLESLNLAENELEAEGVEALVPALQAMTGLESLNLAANELEPEGAEALVPALEAMTGLKTLDLRTNGLEGEGVEALVPSLQAMTGLESLNLAASRMGPEGAEALVPALEAMTGLKTLVLSYSKLGPEGAEALVPALEAMTGLKTLDLRGNELEPEGVEVLVPALQEMTGLESLNLECNKLGPEGVKMLVPALQAITGLESLDLRSNQLGPGGVKALVPALEAMTGLKTLVLRKNELEAEDAKALAPALEAMTGLESLNLAANKLGLEGVKALVPALQAITGLESLDLRWNFSNDVSDDVKSEIKKNLQNIKSFSIHDRMF